jgi:hypothetical protein
MFSGKSENDFPRFQTQVANSSSDAFNLFLTQEQQLYNGYIIRR